MALAPRCGVAEYRVRSADGPIDPREQAAVTLEGDLWRVKVEDND